MAETAIIPMQQRRGTITEWTTSNPVLREAEYAFITDYQLTIMGNGVDDFQTLMGKTAYQLVSIALLNSTFNTLNGFLTAEATARANADTALSTRVTSTENSIGTMIPSVQANAQAISDLLTNIDTWFGQISQKGQILVVNENTGKLQILNPGHDGYSLLYDSSRPEGVAFYQPKEGDMKVDDYDSDRDGVVDNSEMLGGVAASLYALKTDVDNAISLLVNGSPALLDTLSELSNALSNDPNFATTIATQIAAKEPTITGSIASRFWDGTKVFRQITQSDISGLISSLAAKEDSITPTNSGQFWDGTKVFRAIAQSDITGLISALAAKEDSITAPADASKFWDGTKAFRVLTSSDIPSAIVNNRKSFLYYKRRGGWYNNGINTTAFSIIGLTANSANAPLAFLVIEETTVITDIAIEVTTAGSAGSVLHFGLYQVTNPLSAYNSGPLVASTTTGIAADSTGIKSLTLASPVSLSPGVYLCSVSTNSTTSVSLRSLAQSAMIGLYGNASVSSAQISSLLGNRASFAALPSNLSSFTSVTTVGLTNSFVFWYKIQ